MSKELLSRLPVSLADTLAPAVDAGVLRPLDIALVQLLARHSDQPCDTTLTLAAWCSQQHGSGHICLNIADSCATPEQLLPEQTQQKAGAMAWWQQQNAADLLTRLGASRLVDAEGDREGNTPLVLDNGRLYLRRNWRDEVDVSDGVQQRLHQPVNLPSELAHQLDALFPPQPDIDWQKVACAMAARSNLTLITGGPGTGKTTTVVKLLALLQETALNTGRPLRIRLAAPTGKAAARLTDAIGRAADALPVDDSVKAAIPRDVTTLHKLLGRRPDSRRFHHNADNPLHADLVVVDEASMIDLDMMASLLRALAPTTRLVLIGDKDQLASVEAGAVMGDLCMGAASGQYQPDTTQWIQQLCGADVSAFAGQGSPLAQHTTMLRTSHRFDEASGIGALASAANDGDASRCARIWSAGHDDLHRLAADANQLARLAVEGYGSYLKALQQQRPDRPDDVDQWCRNVLHQLSQFQLLCALRQGPLGLQSLNEKIAHALCQAGLLERSDGWYEGRPVMVTRNDYQTGLMNGDVGVTLAMPQEDGSRRLRVVFQLADGGLKRILPSRLDQVETTFAMTVHKSQGSEFDHAALVLPDDGAAVISRELLYTAITRARSRFTLVSNGDSGWQSALQRPTRRSSGLADRLHGSNKA